MEQLQIPSEGHSTHAPERMVFIAAGRFDMGSLDGGQFEQPVHSVNLDGYWIDRFLVTNAEFSRFVRETDHVTTAERSGAAWGYSAGRHGEVVGLSWRSYATVDRSQHPVVLVSWDDAAAYAAWAGMRLPTEAEWEKAARGGNASARYPWGDNEPTAANAPFGRTPSELPPTSPVGSHPSNAYGIHDMAGNVWQWCADWYGADYYASTPPHNPRGPESGELRVRRGAAWNIIQTFRLRCANRGAVPPNTCVPNLGFRCAMDATD